jgi:SAM-dependent methyltransferase
MAGMTLFSKFLESVTRARRYKEYKRQFDEFSRITRERASRNAPLWEDRYPCLDDSTAATGFDRHYIYHPAWAARILAQTRPDKHVDISSTLNFCSIVSAFVPFEFFDYRPATLVLPGLKSKSADLTNLDWTDASVSSLSCMHVIEHIGLGRYGDPIDPDGDLRAIFELVRVLAPGGSLLVAVPVGQERICFNAHRIYDARRFASHFLGLELIDFALIPDGDVPDGLIRDNAFDIASQQSYGCGCFWFKRPA